MCGITGSFDPLRTNSTDSGLLRRMTTKLTHRGPDSWGFYNDGIAAFGFRRLAILDLVAGDQPMCNEKQSVISICNGEFYNYLELRHHLESKGHKFHTRCDSELLPHLYEEYGMGLLDQLDGQFAFAIYDKQRCVLYLARDHFGVQPLFYAKVQGAFIFASEVKALLEHPGLPKEIDLTGLDQVLCFPGLIGPTTMIKTVNSVRNGEYITVTADNVRRTEYWDLNYPLQGDTAPVADEHYYIQKLEELLSGSVSKRLQADVPVGIYLSGGLDSSLVAGVVRAVSPETSRHTFSVSFRGKEMCEGMHQQKMASLIQSEHHDVPFDSHQVIEKLCSTVYHSECPLRETYNSACMALSEEARACGVPVILTGQGSDELFAGYPGYRLDRFFASQRQAPRQELSHEEELRVQMWGDSSLVYDGNYATLQKLKKKLYAPEIAGVLPEFDCFQSLPINRERLRSRHFVHKRSYLDFKLRLVDHLLADHGDRMAMANSIEVRHPFLDKDVVNFVTRIPPDLKLNRFEEKYILKRVAGRFVPPEIVNREKFGWFSAASPELIKAQESWIHDMLSYDRIRRQGYFNCDTVEALKTEYLAEGFRLNQPLESDLLTFILTFGILKDSFGVPDRN